MLYGNGNVIECGIMTFVKVNHYAVHYLEFHPYTYELHSSFNLSAVAVCSLNSLK